VSHQVRYIGKSAHAGGAPDRGINALQAAMLAKSAINAQRETFQESEVVRVHGIITRGGDSVNTVPNDVLYEGRVRARSLEAIQSVVGKVIRCYRAGALAMGAAVEVQTIAGYHPLKQNPIMKELFIEKSKLILGQDSITVVPDEQIHGGSTDMGDLSAIMPVIHPYANAASGVVHGDDYIIDDYNLAVIASAKVMTATIIELLGNGAQTANRVIDTFAQAFTAAQYITVQRERFSNTFYDLK
jgi:metal-dependent amidase/aminoacylase/carboxypeptidase family protein